ncbi:hypothetical protein H072_6772 [Dactylellina haptotyla CBS 200.50]|uniref:non-specific serine/threonine protein kinase n=1 Tax=Dactylellina haptotyla (strain CBS 200.50) TaxID=1284197 RepID=S8BVV4_DACHA|nr:hypothetical protein H072_6772 [Dactylellina haptotyla CBS 200.50]
MAQYFLDLVYTLTSCMSCFPTPALVINHRSFKILRLLGEHSANASVTITQGGFSYVYLVQDNSGTLYALKKIRCPFGQESLNRATSEIQSYKLFPPSPLLIPLIDSTIITERRDESKTAYILLPYYRRGNLQDAINANLVDKNWFPEKHLLSMFKGVCEGLALIHGHKAKGPAVTGGQGQSNRSHDDEEEGVALMEGSRDITGGAQSGDLRPFAHRDIKPGNVMISDDGVTPVLMDFGSLAPSPVHVTSRSLAIQIQDEAAEHSTMSYRAPELFDVKTDSVIDTKVDIWSLGCLLYALIYHHSPFELSTELGGGSLALAISSGDWKFPGPGQTGARPESDDISEATKEIVRKCLIVEPEGRPDIQELIKIVGDAVDSLEED